MCHYTYLVYRCRHTTPEPFFTKCKEAIESKHCANPEPALEYFDLCTTCEKCKERRELRARLESAYFSPTPLQTETMPPEKKEESGKEEELETEKEYESPIDSQSFSQDDSFGDWEKLSDLITDKALSAKIVEGLTTQELQALLITSLEESETYGDFKSTFLTMLSAFQYRADETSPELATDRIRRLWMTVKRACKKMTEGKRLFTKKAPTEPFYRNSSAAKYKRINSL
jgi:hypothetical protein